MSESPATRASLLVRIRDGRDGAAWAQFVEIYAPLVYGYGRRHGLQDADAADLTQEVLRAVARSAAALDYDPRRGSFRGWLFTVARNKLRNFLAALAREVASRGHTAAHALLEAQPARAEADSWDREYEERLFAWAAERVRGEFQDSTWQAFWLTAVEGQSAGDVALSLGISPGAVYIAKSRVLARLRKEVEHLQEE